MDKILKSVKLDNVSYDIRGPVKHTADKMMQQGIDIINLFSGNPPAFGINAPDEIIQDMVLNLKNAEAYSHENGIFPARKAIMQFYQLKGIMDIKLENIFIGNGVSEMILMSMQGLLNNRDEVLVPAPDYPLWTAAVNLSGGKAVHYICDESQDWFPDLQDLESKITQNTRGIVVINPNNPTGAVYPKEILEKIVDLAVRHKLIIFADEIYDRILYDDVVHTPLATLSQEILFVSFNGLSKSHRIPGFRTGWMVLSGNTANAKDYIEGLNILAGMRMCSNVPSQYIIQTALGGYQSLTQLISPGGRLLEQRNAAYKIFNSMPGISCVKPTSTLYLFPKIDTKKYKVTDDEQFVLDFLLDKKVLLVHGRAFNWGQPDHFRVVFLPSVKELEIVGARMTEFLTDYSQK